MTREKQWCIGAGKLAPLKEPASLVDCPVCDRKGLGATSIRNDEYAHNSTRRMGTVPNHAAHAMRPEQIPECGFASPEDAWQNWRGYARPM